jgi:hypothetical protein
LILAKLFLPVATLEKSPEETPCPPAQPRRGLSGATGRLCRLKQQVVEVFAGWSHGDANDKARIGTQEAQTGAAHGEACCELIAVAIAEEEQLRDASRQADDRMILGDGRGRPARDFARPAVAAILTLNALRRMRFTISGKPGHIAQIASRMKLGAIDQR